MKTPDPKANIEAELDAILMKVTQGGITWAVKLQAGKETEGDKATYEATEEAKQSILALFQTTMEAAEVAARIDENKKLLKQCQKVVDEFGLDEANKQVTIASVTYYVQDRLAHLHHKKGTE